MLVLGRKENESIRIGDSVKVTVVAVSGGCAQLAIEAPRSVTVHREEIWIKIQEQQKHENK